MPDMYVAQHPVNNEFWGAAQGPSVKVKACSSCPCLLPKPVHGPEMTRRHAVPEKFREVILAVYMDGECLVQDSGCVSSMRAQHAGTSQGCSSSSSFSLSRLRTGLGELIESQTSLAYLPPVTDGSGTMGLELRRRLGTP